MFRMYDETPSANEGAFCREGLLIVLSDKLIVLSDKSQSREVTSDFEHFCRDVSQNRVSEKSQVRQNRSHKLGASRGRPQNSQVRQIRSHK